MHALPWLSIAVVGMAVGCGVSFRQGGEGGSATSAGAGGLGTGGSKTSSVGGGGMVGGAGGTGAGEPIGGSGGRGRLGCPVGLPGRSLVFVDAGAGTFCIDETEVTVGDYAAFEAAATPPQNSVECAWNATYSPRIGSFECEAQDYDLSAPDNAVSCIDWCDARDFCAWAGKRLCGKIGGGPNDLDAFDDPLQDEWMNACSAGGTTTFPYGDVYEPTTCIGDDFDGVDDGPDDHPQGVMDAPACEGGIPGLFGMSGHLWEWTNACDAAAMDPAQTRCRLRGGSFWDNDNRLFCAAPDFSYFVRDYANKNHGFRCCADPVSAE